jgi:hypothetical protein
MEPPSAAARAAVPRPPSFASQTNALLRKNLIFQVNPYGIHLSCSFSFEVAPQGTSLAQLQNGHAVFNFGNVFLLMRKRLWWIAVIRECSSSHVVTTHHLRYGNHILFCLHLGPAARRG